MEEDEFFDQFANTTINDVASFQLSWCKLNRLPKAAWVSENTNAFMRLFSYLNGIFFLNHPVDDDKQMHCINMSQMMNALQACISMLIARGDIEGSEVEKYMKLLMSTAHCLQKNLVQSAKRKIQIRMIAKGIPNRNSTDLVDQLSHHDVLRLLEILNQIRHVKLQ